MKRFSSFIFGVLAVFLCVAAVKAPVKSLLLDNKGNWLIVKNQVVQSSKALSQDDIKRISKAAQGINETDAVNTTVHSNAISKTVMKHKTDLKASVAGREILSILKKYKPKQTELGILIIDNKVVQASRSLSRDDLKRMQAISQENKAASTFVNKALYEDFVDESLYTSGLKKGGPELRAKYASIMDKYMR